MSDTITSVHGHKVYRHHDFPCVCIDFDYWGTPATLQVPYALYRTFEVAEYCDKGVSVGIAQIRCNSVYIAENQVATDTSIPPVSDHELQKRLKAFKNDGTGRDNTDTLMRYNSPAAQLCRNIEVPGLPLNYFDLGNLYELAIIWLESDNIDLLDPTAEDYKGKMLGFRHPKGRFSGIDRNVKWSSSEYDSFSAWCVDYDGYVASRARSTSYGVVPSRTILHNIKHDSHKAMIDEICEELTGAGTEIYGCTAVNGAMVLEVELSANVFAVLIPEDYEFKTIGYISGIDREYTDVTHEFTKSLTKIREAKNKIDSINAIIAIEDIEREKKIIEKNNELSRLSSLLENHKRLINKFK